MFAYERFRAVGLTRVDFILLFNEEQLLAMLENPGPGESWSRALLRLELPASRPQDPDVSKPEPGNLARKAFEELRRKLDGLGLMPLHADWDTARGVN
jgi:hypothetical protein